MVGDDAIVKLAGRVQSAEAKGARDMATFPFHFARVSGGAQVIGPLAKVALESDEENVLVALDFRRCVEARWFLH